MEKEWKEGVKSKEGEERSNEEEMEGVTEGCREKWRSRQFFCQS